MSSEIITAKEYVQQLKEKFSGFKVPEYKLKSLYSTKHQIFFDCEEQDQVTCLKKILKERHFRGFTVFIVTKGSTGSFQFMNIHFKNIGAETLEHFIKRFHIALEPSTKLSLQMAESEYVTCFGYSYSDS